MKVTNCESCNEPVVVAVDEKTGDPFTLDLYAVPSGPYTIADGIARIRKTKNGKRATGGKGHRLHGSRCPGENGIASTAHIDKPEDDLKQLVEANDRRAQRLVPPEDPNDTDRCAVRIELQDTLGTPQSGTGSVDLTGLPTGHYACTECGEGVIVCYHELRPDGTWPVILDARRHPRMPWRIYRKQDSDVLLCGFTGKKNELSEFVNHRIMCPTAGVVEL